MVHAVASAHWFLIVLVVLLSSCISYHRLMPSSPSPLSFTPFICWLLFQAANKAVVINNSVVFVVIVHPLLSVVFVICPCPLSPLLVAVIVGSLLPSQPVLWRGVLLRGEAVSWIDFLTKNQMWCCLQLAEENASPVKAPLTNIG
jgi:hypothetical protein